VASARSKGNWAKTSKSGFLASAAHHGLTAFACGNGKAATSVWRIFSLLKACAAVAQGRSGVLKP
jgi:hypothetical protein